MRTQHLRAATCSSSSRMLLSCESHAVLTRCCAWLLSRWHVSCQPEYSMRFIHKTHTSCMRVARHPCRICNTCNRHATGSAPPGSQRAAPLQCQC
jgi:hypothetical protein